MFRTISLSVELLHSTPPLHSGSDGTWNHLSQTYCQSHFKLVQAFKFRHAGLVHLHMRRLKNPLDKTPKLLFEIVPLTSTSVASLRPQMSKFENAILHTTFAPINLRKQVTLPTPTHPFKAIPTAHPLLSDAHGNL